MAGKRGPKMGPRGRNARAPEGQQRVMNLFKVQVSFDLPAFREFVQSQGIRVIHYRAVPDPTGMTSRGDSRAVDGESKRSSDGFIYEEVGTMQVLFYSNGSSENFVKEGAIEYATAYMTLPDIYEKERDTDPDCPVLVMPWDRFFVKDVEVRVLARQYIETNSTGIDRLQFPATCVESLRDANGASYTEGQDFSITDEGHIKWLTQRRPGWNPDLGRGTVYGIRYRYTPFFVCSKIIHEIRVAQVTNPSTLERRVERFPYQIEVVRENVFHDVNAAEKDLNPSDDTRFQAGPPSGGMLGPTG